MKVSVYDEQGELIGIAWHENDVGYVELPPSKRVCVATHFTINDGPKQELTSRVQVPVDGELRLRVRDPARKPPADDYFSRILREAFSNEKEVDKTATDVTWWGKIKRAFGG